jgi:hypothetical protein
VFTDGRKQQQPNHNTTTYSRVRIFSLMRDSLQTAWSQGSSKYQKQKKCIRSEISINLSFYVYIIPKRNNYSSNSNKTKGKWLQS